MTRLTRRKWFTYSAGTGLGFLLSRQLHAAPKDISAVAAEIDSNYYLPQKQGLKYLLGQFELPELEKRLKKTLEMEAGTNPELSGMSARTRLEALYSWDADKRTRFAIDGWPKGYDPLELKRHQGVHQQMAEAIVPDEHAYFFKDFDISVERSTAGLVVTGRKKVAYARVDSFTKVFSPDFMRSSLRGAGPEAVFQTDVEYQLLDGKRVFRNLDFKVRVGAVDLFYKIEPYYGMAEGFLLPTKVALTYFDENGQVIGVPFDIVAKQYAVNSSLKPSQTGKSGSTKK